MKFKHMRREFNQLADFLANVAMARKGNLSVGELGIRLEFGDDAPWDPWQ